MAELSKRSVREFCDTYIPRICSDMQLGPPDTPHVESCVYLGLPCCIAARLPA